MTLSIGGDSRLAPEHKKKGVKFGLPRPGQGRPGAEPLRGCSVVVENRITMCGDVAIGPYPGSVKQA